MGGFISYIFRLAQGRISDQPSSQPSKPFNPWARAILLGFSIVLMSPAAGLCKEPGYAQKGAFRVKKNADKMLRELESSGAAAFLLEKTFKGKPLYLVMVPNAKVSAKDAPMPQEANGAGKPEPIPDYHSSSAYMLHGSSDEAQATDPGGRIILKPLSMRMQQTLAISPNAEVRTSPDENSTVISKAGDMGDIWYVKTAGQWHTLWLEDSRYGYVKDSDGSLVKAGQGQSQSASVPEGLSHTHSN